MCQYIDSHQNKLRENSSKQFAVKRLTTSKMSVRILLVLLLIEIFLCEPSNAFRRRRLRRDFLLREELKFQDRMREYNNKMINIVYDQALVCREPEFFGWSSSECYGDKSPRRYIKYARDISCGKWRTIDDLAHSCKFNSDCDAFTVRNGNPMCMKQFFENTYTVLDNNYDIYYVRSDLRKPIKQLSFKELIVGTLMWCIISSIIIFGMYLFGGFSNLPHEETYYDDDD